MDVVLVFWSNLNYLSFEVISETDTLQVVKVKKNFLLGLIESLEKNITSIYSTKFQSPDNHINVLYNLVLIWCHIC